MNYFLAIDIGASSGRHILGCIRNGILETEEIYRFPNSPLMVNNRLVWDIGRLFTEILTGMKRAGELGKAPYAVGIDTWAVDYVLLDRDRNLIGEAYSYRDPRTERAVAELHARIPFERLYALTGIQFQPFNTVYRLRQDITDGRLALADKLLMLPDYFHYRLTGRLGTEYTNATSTGLVNAFTRTWDEEILSAVGLRKSIFAPMLHAGSELGGLTPEIQRLVGYDARVIIPATHDTASAVIGSQAEDAPYLSSGTWSLLGIVQPEAHTDCKSRAFNFSNEGHIENGYRYQKNITGLWMLNRLRAEECPELSFAELTALAEGSANDCMVDVNDARFLAPPNMRLEIGRASGVRLTVGEAAYCVLNGLAACYAKSITELEEVLGQDWKTLNIVGGGSKNTLLNRLTEQYTKKNITVGPAEATVVGNLVMQMLSQGIITDWKEAKKLIRSLTKTS